MFFFKHITLAGLIIGSIWIGVGYLVDRDAARAKLDNSAERMKESVRAIDPWLMKNSFMDRVSCAALGNCEVCQTVSQRLVTINCGRHLLFLFSNDKTNDFYGLLSVPVALLFMLSKAWAGGWLVFFPGASSIILAYIILLKPLEQRNWLFVFCWSWALAALIEEVFRLILLGVLNLFGAFLVVLGYLSFPLAALEVCLKFGHASELGRKLGHHSGESERFFRKK